MVSAWQRWGSNSCALPSRKPHLPCQPLNAMCWHQRRGKKQHQLATKLAAQGKHSTEATKAMCLDPLCVLGAAESGFSC